MVPGLNGYHPMDSFRFIIAGGGTGGHLFPGIAIARELQARFENSRILFVVGRRRMESEILRDYGYRVASIDVEGLKGRGWEKGLNVLARLPKSLCQSASIIKATAPRIVLGMGGYSSGPMCVAARVMGIPTAIHEQNSYPGLTNRLLSRFVDRVFISFGESRRYLKAGKVLLTGNPVREELFQYNDTEHKYPEKFTILVMGGSQGAKAINMAFIEALTILRSRGKNPEVVHQSGKTDYQRVVEDYTNRGIDVKTVPFIQDMAMAYGCADLVVSRAGATTIFELAALGKPSILIPYPYAANQHQDTNARSLVSIGGAEMIHQGELTGEGLAQVLMKYMDDRSRLQEMSKQVQKMGRRDAAKGIVNQLAEMMR